MIAQDFNAGWTGGQSEFILVTSGPPTDFNWHRLLTGNELSEIPFIHHDRIQDSLDEDFLTIPSEVCFGIEKPGKSDGSRIENYSVIECFNQNGELAFNLNLMTPASRSPSRLQVI